VHCLDEMDMIPDKNANEVWKHLKETYEPKGGKANDYLEMKLVKCELESHKKVNGSWEIDIVDTDEDGDEEEVAVAINGSTQTVQTTNKTKGCHLCSNEFLFYR